MNKKIIIGALMILLLSFVTIMAFAQSNQNIRWEYRALAAAPANTLIQRMNGLGAEGWELTEHLPQFGSDGTLIFRRRLP